MLEVVAPITERTYKSNKTRRIYKYSFHQVKQTVESDIKYMH